MSVTSAAVLSVVSPSRDEIGAILSRYESYLMAIASRELPRSIGNRVDPADVVQTTLMDVAKFMATNEVEIAKLGGLLRASLLHNITSEIRTHNAAKRTVRREFYVPFSNFLTELGDREQDASPVDAMIVREEIGQLMDAMAELSPIHCEVLRLRYFDGLSRAEVGERIGRTEQATAGLLKRAKATLQGAMLAASA